MSPAASWLLIISIASSLTIGGMWLYIKGLQDTLREYQEPW